MDYFTGFSEAPYELSTIIISVITGVETEFPRGKLTWPQRQLGEGEAKTCTEVPVLDPFLLEY